MLRWLQTYDLNLPLLDILKDPESEDVQADLAARSLAEGLDSGFYDAEALADAVSHLLSEIDAGLLDPKSDARVALSDLLARAPGYTNCIHAVVKDLSPREAARHLAWLTRLMKDRADMARLVREAGVTIALSRR